MKYLTLDDLDASLKRNITDDLSENNYSILNTIEDESINEIESYIGFKFDVQVGLKINSHLRMILKDIFIYHFTSRMSHTSMQEIREVRYENAKTWLKDLFAGKIGSTLPMKQEAVNEYVSKNYYITEPLIGGSY